MKYAEEEHLNPRTTTRKCARCRAEPRQHSENDETFFPPTATGKRSALIQGLSLDHSRVHTAGAKRTAGSGTRSTPPEPNTPLEPSTPPDPVQQETDCLRRIQCSRTPAPDPALVKDLPHPSDHRLTNCNIWAGSSTPLGEICNTAGLDRQPHMMGEICNTAGLDRLMNWYDRWGTPGDATCRYKLVGVYTNRIHLDIPHILLYPVTYSSMSCPKNIPYPGGGYATQWYTRGHTIRVCTYHTSMYIPYHTHTVSRGYSKVDLPHPSDDRLKNLKTVFRFSPSPQGAHPGARIRVVPAVDQHDRHGFFDSGSGGCEQTVPMCRSSRPSTPSRPGLRRLPIHTLGNRIGRQTAHR